MRENNTRGARCKDNLSVCRNQSLRRNGMMSEFRSVPAFPQVNIKRLLVDHNLNCNQSSSFNFNNAIRRRDTTSTRCIRLEKRAIIDEVRRKDGVEG